MNTSKAKQNYINHIALVLDKSWSMHSHETTVPKVADSLIKELADQSKILDQETRVSVYTFDSRTECLIYDKDVLRVPSISGLYKIGDNTALCSATTVAIKDLKHTWEEYGEHSFLIYVITDGQENVSLNTDKINLPGLIGSLPDHWTLAAFVPDARGIHFAKSFGFPAGNIAVWDTASGSGFVEVGEVIQRSTRDFMQARTTGVRGSRNLFTMNPVSVHDIQKNLTPMTPGSYFFEKINPSDTPDGEKVRIDQFCTSKFGSYTPGMGLYEMTKRETIQDYKKIALYVPADGHLYVGRGTRAKLGLPESGDIRVSPGDHKGYKIFVQSTANNRNLFAGTELLVMR